MFKDSTVNFYGNDFPNFCSFSTKKKKKDKQIMQTWSDVLRKVVGHIQINIICSRGAHNYYNIANTKDVTHETCGSVSTGSILINDVTGIK